MNMRIASIFAICLGATPLWAESHASGDAEAGEKVFRKCKSCHMIQDDEGNDIQKGGRTGPNLYGIYNRVAG
ncbi:MAG TPA: cytochrome C, partial [Sulfitobacter sp.]|nr:cytochrome C [Sulfitobacter sp.]